MSAGEAPDHSRAEAVNVSGWLRICESARLVERGEGVRFDLPPGSSGHQARAAFAIRHDERVRAYLNQCAHVPVELDWLPGKFLDESREFLICATHGATYRPDDGFCVGGPCKGRRLQALECMEHEGHVWVREN